MGGFLQIGDLARQTGLSADTIRFYERERLLRRPVRSSGGFRLFSQSDVADLAFIRNAQNLGFSLEEIRDLVDMKNARHSDCAEMERTLKRKIATVRVKISALRKLERELKQATVRCQKNLSQARSGQTGPCPALTDISNTNEGKRR
jgi:DNA-binding transcriptional MerR regulator